MSLNLGPGPPITEPKTINRGKNLKQNKKLMYEYKVTLASNLTPYIRADYIKISDRGILTFHKRPGGDIIGGFNSDEWKAVNKVEPEEPKDETPKVQPLR